MSLRARMALATGVAVALAVIAVAFSAYEGTRSQLQGQVDQSLRSLTGSVLASAGLSAQRPAARPRLGPERSRPGRGRRASYAGCRRRLRRRQSATTIPTRSTTRDWVSTTAAGPRSAARPGRDDRPCAMEPATRRPARRSGSRSMPGPRRSRPGAAGHYYTDMTVDGTRIRVLATGIQVARGAARRAPAHRRRRRALQPAAAAGPDLRRRDPARRRARAARGHGRRWRRSVVSRDRPRRSRTTRSGSRTSGSTSMGATSWRAWRRPSTAPWTRSSSQSRPSATWLPTPRTSCAPRSPRSGPTCS